MELKSYFYKNKIFQTELLKIKPDIFLKISSLSFESVEKKAAEIKRCGIISPILIRPDIKEKESYFCFSNPETLAALNLLNAKKVPTVIARITCPEAALYYLLNNKDLNIIKKAELLNFLLKEGRFTIRELADSLSISASAIDTLLLPLVLNKKEKAFFESRGFGYKLLKSFLKLPNEEKETVLNKIIAGELSESQAINLCYEILNPKQKQIKSFTLKNDEIILNSLERITTSLNENGIKAYTSSISNENFSEYKIILEKSIS